MIASTPITLTRLHHVVIEGPIGVGKTSLARKLAPRLGAQLLLEAPGENPFLERFYRDPLRYALATQMFFLFQRARQMADLAQLDLFRQHLVADFLLAKDALFAELTLAEDELKLYRQMFAALAPAAPAPDLVIYLQAPAEVLIERVSRRGLSTEAGISASYLKTLTERYVRFFHNYDESPLLVVNTEHLNPIDRDADFDLLVDRISRMRGRREVFNLAA